MPGPISTTDINILEIDSQLGSPYGPTDFSLYNCYNFASTASAIALGSAGMAGNFHNLAMGVGSPGLFAQQIWGVWHGGGDYPVGNWGNYFYDANVVLDWNISMDPAFKPADVVSVDLYLSDAYSAGFLSLVANITLSPGQSSVQTDFDTGLAAYSGYHTTGYWIYANISLAGSTSNAFVSLPSGTFSDTDGVGPDTSRSRRTAGMPWNIGSSGSSFSGVLFGGSAINAQIAYNKRTSFRITVTP